MKDQIMHSNKPILVFGATGRMGGAVARHLHRDGWCVKAISRSPESEKAKSLIARGIEVMQGDMDEPDTLRQVFKDAYGVFLTVNWFDSGIEGELRQSRNVADLAAASGVQHLVFGAAGIGERGTGLKHFEVKLDIVDDLLSKNVPTTVIYSAPFMELMTDPTLFPQLITWNAKIKVIGKDLPVPWIATEDIGALATVAFNDPEEFVGRGIKPVGDWKTMDECLQIYQATAGKKPVRIPLPIWLMRLMIPQMTEMVKMWEWMRSIDNMPAIESDPLSNYLVDVTDVRTFLQRELASPDVD